MRFWTSDTHFGHANIIRYTNRPYSDADEMNEDIIRIWNETVGVDDDVIIVGDFALGKIADTLPLVGFLNGHKTLICGNHDRPWDGHKKTGTWYQKYLDAGFDEVYTGRDTFYEQGAYVFDIGGIAVKVSHFPYVGDSRHEDRFTDWRPIDHGDWLVHGHVHDIWQVNGRQINVGWDVWNRPVTDEDLLRIIRDFESVPDF